MSIADFQYKLQRYLLILAVGMFALAAVDYAEQQSVVLATVMAIAAALNLLAFIILRLGTAYLGAILHLANAMVALLVAFDLFGSGKQYLPYVWVLVAILYVVATIVALLKALRQKS